MKCVLPFLVLGTWKLSSNNSLGAKVLHVALLVVPSWIWDPVSLACRSAAWNCFGKKTLGYWELTRSPNHRWKDRCSNECPLALLSLKGTTAQRPFFKAGGTLTNKQPPWIKNLKLLPQKHYRVPRNEKNHQKIKNHRNMILNPKTCPHFSNWSSWSSRWTTFLRKKSRRVMG